MDLMNRLGPTPDLEPGVAERMGVALDQARGRVPRAGVRAWRDRMVLAIRRLKATNPIEHT